LTSQTKHYISRDYGNTWLSFEVDSVPNFTGRSPIVFHGKRAEFMLYEGEKCNMNNGKRECFQETHYTNDGFHKVELLRTYTTQCMWGQPTPKFDASPTHQIYCTEYATKTGHQPSRTLEDIRLVQTQDYFKSYSTIQLGGSVLALGNMDRFLVSIVKIPRESAVEFHVSVGGMDFRKGRFLSKPSPHIMSYTVLESSEHSLTVVVSHSSSNSPFPLPYGTLFMSTSDGFHFRPVLENISKNLDGRVDVERIQNHFFEGILIANVVDNPQEALSGKKIVSKISFDNGASWNPIKLLAQSSDSTQWSCSDPQCSLHLHGAMNNHNQGHVFSSAGAVGVLLGVGNVGRSLESYNDGDTFLSTDAGITWKMIAKGPHKYETLDMGSLIVLVPENWTDRILYSW
jgi:hypothetical protein